MKISIIGCGWLGFPLALHLLQKGYAVKGSSTQVAKIPALEAAGIEAHLLRLEPAPEGNLSALLEADALICNIPPQSQQKGMDFHPAQIAHLTAAVAKSPIKQVIYVSSTSVYCDSGSPVVESDAHKMQNAHPALIAAEEQWLALPQVQTTVLRCGGLMGKERIAGKYFAGKQVPQADVPVNLVHQTDVIRIIEMLLERQWGGEIYNVVAPEHPSRRELYTANAWQFGFAMPIFGALSEASAAGKVVSSEKLQKALGYHFLYPNPLDFWD
jgi:nucleoside-diphosphate-sugar epimerase